jgi:hypothetical protein
VRSRFLELAQIAVHETSSREETVAAVAELLSKQVAEERRRCVAICRSRAELWRRTPAAHARIATAREEARARANEATYLADLIESDPELATENAEPTN